jgi:tRNA nucleotidyltransferase/poly(A) polymerase
VRYGQDIIEVATFRAAHTPIDDDNSVDEGGHRVLDAHGRILRDNLYGTIDEDVWRRDFTANALYYNIQDFSVWDYTGGVEDARARVLKLIGDPETRYHEDAVRMLRAIRFAAKLNFTIDRASAEPIARLAGMLDSIPAARLFDEVCHGRVRLADSLWIARTLVAIGGARPGAAVQLQCRTLVAVRLARHRRARPAGQIRDANFLVRRLAVAGN